MRETLYFNSLRRMSSVINCIQKKENIRQQRKKMFYYNILNTKSEFRINLEFVYIFSGYQLNDPGGFSLG